MSNLTEQDKETIEAIVKAQLEHYKLIQPTAKDEVIEDVKERFKPREDQLYYYVNYYKKDSIGSFCWQGDDTDIDLYELGNCFKTEQEANEIANKIKQLLQTL